ncbi:SMP-30/gluconolactonase/LRE family protein [Pseudonocardia sp. TRM90224]|uniref:SMP-30/gluconolactonase/LRE family protein n=1 Tax=Pseudonocardia sp. TRM90224 TaxID=2812678 RepID=UPI001E34A509|nr:hypothetical protein [Pseudonocardia sp. TRM90224]
MKVVLDGLAIGESPRWHDGRLWFCNWGPDELVAMTPDGEHEVVALDPSVRPHSIEWLPDGRMLVVPKDPEHQGLLLRVEPDGGIAVHADLRPIAAGWNEIVVDGRGNVYVNGSDFDFLGFLKGRWSSCRASSRWSPRTARCAKWRRASSSATAWW